MCFLNQSHAQMTTCITMVGQHVVKVLIIRSLYIFLLFLAVSQTEIYLSLSKVNPTFKKRLFFKWLNPDDFSVLRCQHLFGAHQHLLHAGKTPARVYQAGPIMNRQWSVKTTVGSVLFFGLRWGRGAAKAAHGDPGIRRRGGVSGVLPLWFRLLGCLLHDWNQLQPRGALLHGPGEGRCVL